MTFTYTFPDGLLNPVSLFICGLRGRLLLHHHELRILIIFREAKIAPDLFSSYILETQLRHDGMKVPHLL